MIKLALVAVAAVISCVTPAAAADTTIKFAAIGDVGNTANSTAVANLIKSNLGPNDFVMLLGDDCYDSSPSLQSTLDPRYGTFHTSSRLYSTLGNHEVSDVCGGGAYAKNYFSYFALPGNERYYTFRKGPVQFFVANSEEVTDGNGPNSRQAAWMRQQIVSSTAPWKICVFHRSAYSSGSEHGSTTYMRWGWAGWGINACLMGHDHDYERVMTYPLGDAQGRMWLTCGLGGRGYKPFGTIIPGSKARYTGGYGACFITATTTSLKVEFKNIQGKIVDTMILTK